MIISGLLEIGKLIVDGVSGHYKDKRELKKVEVEAQKKVIVAEAEAKIEMAKQGQLQDFDLDMQAMKNMDKSWKDELILVIFLIPVVMSFIPGLAPYVAAGFAVLASTPEWYMYIVIGMVVVIYGMRSLATKVISGMSLRGKK